MFIKEGNSFPMYFKVASRNEFKEIFYVRDTQFSVALFYLEHYL